MNALGIWWALKGEQYLRELTRESLWNVMRIGLVVTITFVVPLTNKYKELFAEWYISNSFTMAIIEPLKEWQPQSCTEYRHMIQYVEGVIIIRQEELGLVDDILVLERFRTFVTDRTREAAFSDMREYVRVSIDMLRTLRSVYLHRFNEDCTQTA